MSKICELFGLNCGDANLDLKEAMRAQLCPYTQRSCTKMRKSDPDIKIGTCSVRFQGENVIICPFRLLERNQIFIDCLHLLTLHEPGNELYLIPEVQIPGGHVDYFLVSAKEKKIKDFIGIELQTMDTTGTVWPERQKFLHERGIEVDTKDLENRKSFGMNWKMTLKTILIQMHHKSKTFENINKHLVLIVQKPLYDHMRKNFDFQGVEGVRVGDPVHIHSYQFEEEDNSFRLSLHTRVSTDSAGIARSLGLKTEGKVELEELIRILEPKIIEANRLKVALS